MLKFELYHQERETHVVLCVQQHHIVITLTFCSGERDSCFFLCAAASFVKIWTLSSGKRDSCCFLCAAASFVKIQTLSSGERDSRCFLCASASLHNICVFFLCWERLPLFLMCSRIIDQDLCFPIRREGLSISFHYCRICLQILFEKTFSMLFNLSRCSSAENFCN